MKPTPQITPDEHAPRPFPLTDYNFQATAETPTSSSAVVPAEKSPAFHKLSSELFGVEAERHFIAELLFFILISGVTAWPVMSMLHAITRMVRNY
jgi:hypothetical protein